LLYSPLKFQQMRWCRHVLANANALALEKILDEQRQTNALLERLLVEWGPTSTS
jgi:hypothetical protein